MVVGFNHNFRYKGEVYHIQTEDSGLKSPNIVTLLYQGGTILASKKTSYADIAKVDNLDQVVEELMKEQHKGMLRGLKSGEYDDVIERFQSGKKVVPQVSEGESVSSATVAATEAVVEEAPVEEAAVEEAPVEEAPIPPAPPVIDLKPAPQPEPEPEPKAVPKPPSPTVEIGLDEVILSYLMGDD